MILLIKVKWPSFSGRICDNCVELYHYKYFKGESNFVHGMTRKTLKKN